MIPLQPGNGRPLAHNRLVGGSSSSRTHHALRRLTEISRFSALAPNWPASLRGPVSAKESSNFLRLFPGPLSLPRNSVSRKQRFQFEETRFKCAAIGWEGQAFGAGGTIRPAGRRGG